MLKRSIVFEYRDLLFKQAASLSERDEHIQFRQEIFLQEYGQLAPRELLVEEMSEDAYDKDSVFFNAYSARQLVGTIRFVPDIANRGLPMESGGATSCARFRARGKIVEAGRFAISKEYRITSPHVFIGLMRCLHLYSITQDIYFVVTYMPEHLLAVYKRTGFQIYGEPKVHPIGKKFYPGYLNMAYLICKGQQGWKPGLKSTYREFVEKAGYLERIERSKYVLKIKIKEPFRRNGILSDSLP